MFSLRLLLVACALGLGLLASSLPTPHHVAGLGTCVSCHNAPTKGDR